MQMDKLRTLILNCVIFFDQHVGEFTVKIVNSFISSVYEVTLAFKGISAGDRIANNCG